MTERIGAARGVDPQKDLVLGYIEKTIDPKLLKEIENVIGKITKISTVNNEKNEELIEEGKHPKNKDKDLIIEGTGKKKIRFNGEETIVFSTKTENHLRTKKKKPK